MNAIKLGALALILLGLAALGFCGFSFTERSLAATQAAAELTIDSTRHVNLALWAGLCAIVLGGLVLVFWDKR